MQPLMWIAKFHADKKDMSGLLFAVSVMLYECGH
jgi:hypothetical protein